MGGSGIRGSGRGRALARALRLLQLLRRPGGVTVPRACAELGCGRRTLYRDLAVLQEAGFPLRTNRDGEGTAWILEGRLDLPFDDDEVQALRLGQQAVDASPLGGAGRTALSKISARLGDAARRESDRRATSLRVSTARAASDLATPVTRTLADAAVRRRTVEVLYESSSGRAARRLFDPYGFWLDLATGHFYVAGLAHDRGEVRTLLAARIRSASPTPRVFARPEGWDVSDYLAGSFGGYRGPARDVRLRFRGRAARLVAERVWHATQRLDRAAGSLLLTMRVPISPALEGWILSWLPDVEVLGPPDLVTDVRRRLGLPAARRPGPRRAPSSPGTPRARAARGRSS